MSIFYRYLWGCFWTMITAAMLPAQVTDEKTVQRYREALVAFDYGTIQELIEKNPGLINQKPWGFSDQSALEFIAKECVWNQPFAIKIARYLDGKGESSDLPTAARAGLLERVKKMVTEQPELLNQKDFKGRTALYRAACIPGVFKEAEEVSDYLIEKGANVDIYTACTLGLLDKVKEHLKTGLEPAVKVDPEGSTTLHWAARIRNRKENGVAIMQLLLDNKALVDARDSGANGASPLHMLASWPGSVEQAELLLKFKANLNAVDNRGFTPLDYAIEKQNLDMVEFLKAKGARESGKR